MNSSNNSTSDLIVSGVLDEALSLEAATIEAQRLEVRQQLNALSTELSTLSARKALILTTLAHRKVARDSTPDWQWLLRHDELTREAGNDVRSQALKEALMTLTGDSQGYHRLYTTFEHNEATDQCVLRLQLQVEPQTRLAVLEAIKTLLPHVKLGLPSDIVRRRNKDSFRLVKYFNITTGSAFQDKTYYLAINDAIHRYELRCKDLLANSVVIKTSTLDALLDFVFQDLASAAAADLAARREARAPEPQDE